MKTGCNVFKAKAAYVRSRARWIEGGENFWEDIKLLLFQALIECVNQKELTETMK